MKNKILSLIFSVIFISYPVFSVNAEKQDSDNDKINKLYMSWWEYFNYKYLTEYIIKTEQNNYDLKINELTTAIQKEYTKESFGKELPQISFYPSIARDRLPKENYLTTINVPLGVNYEADVWLKNRTATKITKKEYEVGNYDDFAKLISIISLTAITYIEIIGLDKKIEIQEELVKTREKISELMNVNFQYGICNSTEVTNVEQLYIETLNELERLKLTRDIALNLLSVMIVDKVENSSSIPRGLYDEITIPNNIHKEIPSEVVNNRPDILKAEAELQAGKLDVKLARKAFLPSINLSGFAGFNSNSLSNTFDWENFVANGTAGLVQPIFTGGQLKSKLRAKKYNYDRILAYYQKTILTSLQEINDSLVSIKSTSKQYENCTKRVELEDKKYNDNILYKYDKGYFSYLDTLEYKEKFLLLKKDEIQSKIDYLLAAIGLYKAVAGDIN